MKESEAKKLVTGILIGAQRSRSIRDEMGWPESLEMELEPWLYGPMDCRPMLINLVERLDNGSSLAPLTFMNLLHICKKTPSIGICATNYGYIIPRLDEDIGMADFIGGWEPE